MSPQREWASSGSFAADVDYRKSSSFSPEVSPWSPGHASLHKFIAYMVLFWLVAVLVHHWCCRKFTWYEEKVRSGVIQLSFGRVYLTFTRFNGPIQRLGSWRPLVRMWRMWFICGALLATLLILPAVFFLLYLFYTHSVIIYRHYARASLVSDAAAPLVKKALTTASPFLLQLSPPNGNSPATTVPSLSGTSSMSGSSLSLTPMLPGFNLPWSHLVPLLLSILLSTMLHEFGHALSAASEFTELDGVGVAVLGVIPAAFVVIRNLDSQVLSRQLRIMAAGVWHNVVLALLAAALLVTLPVFVKPVWPSGYGVTVVEVVESPALANHSVPFYPGMEIFSVNECRVNSSRSLERCVLLNSRDGFCLSVDTIKTARGDFIPPVKYKQTPVLDESRGGHDNSSSSWAVMECCRNTSSALCFYGQSQHKNPITSWSSNQTVAATECLQVEKVRNHQRCNVSVDCSSFPREDCYQPYLLPWERLLVLNTSAGPVLFVGEPASLLRALRISNYSATSFLPLWLPGAIEIGLKYILSISIALAVLNVVPCVGLDGQHIFGIWLELLFRQGYLPAKWAAYQSRLTWLVTGACTTLLVADLFMSFALV